MVGSVQAVVLLLLAVLPGAVLVFSYERHAGPLADDVNERTLRFIVGTALIFPYAAGVAGWVYTRILHVPIEGSSDAYRNRLLDPSDVSLWWYVIPVAYVLVPWGLGRLAGLARIGLRRRSVRRRTASLAPGLKAWDIVFLKPGPKLITMKLRNGPWVGGVFASSSFASAPAAKEREVVLEVGVEVDDHGEIQRDEDGTPLLTTASVVVAYVGRRVDEGPASMSGEAVSAHMPSDEPERLWSKVLRALDRSPYEPYTGSSEGSEPPSEVTSELGYSGKRAAEIVGISYRQLDYWVRTDLVRPSIPDVHGSGTRHRYSYRNLLELKLVKTLLDNGIALEQVRRAFRYVREQLGEDPSAARLMIAGDSVVLVREDDDLVDVMNRYQGQGVLNVLALDSIKDQIDAAIESEGEQSEPAIVEDGAG